MWKLNLILSFTALFSSLPVSSLSVGGTEISWQQPPPFKRIKNDWRWNIEALGLGSSANAAHLPPASSWKANTEGTFGWRNCECSNRLFLEHGQKVEWGFGGRCRLDLNAIIRFDTSPTLLRGESVVSECKITAERRVHHCRRSVTVNFVHYSRRCIEQL